MNKIFAIILSSTMMCGCASVKLTRLADIDPNDKTVSMSAGGKLLTGDLKAALIKDGWKVYAIDKSKEIIRGVDDPNATDKRVVVYRESELARKARYHLVDHWTFISKFDGYMFDLSLIDNKNGQEVIILTGHNKTSEQIVKIFIDALYGIEYQGRDRVR